jgi:membrane protein
MYQHFLFSNALTRAGSLAFTTIIAIVPLLVLGLSVLSLFPVSNLVWLNLQQFIFSNFLVSSAEVIFQYVETFVVRAHTLSLVSFVFLMVTAFSMLFSIEGSLNAIWRVDKSRSWGHIVILYPIILLLSPLLLASSFLVTFAINKYMSGLWQMHATWFLVTMTPLISYAGFLLIYKIMPRCFVPWRNASIGAITAAVMFESAKYIFAWYVHAFPTYKIVYGAISVLPILFIWIYICWVIFLIGGLVSYAVDVNKL